MTLGRVIDAIAERLTASLPAAIAVGDSGPAALADLPLVSLSIEHAERRLVGVGSIPRGTSHGALPVDVVIDLANPVLQLGGGETLTLLSGDRRTVTVPHGPLVRRHGTEQSPFEPGDVVATDPNPFTVVGGTPVGRQVRVDPEQGTLLFGVALALTGELRVRYHVGQWDTVTTRYQGVLAVAAIAADTAGTSQLARDVAAVLDRADGSVRLVPTAWRTSDALAIGDDVARRQVLEYRFDAEIEDPLITTSGGVIATVAVAIDIPDPNNTVPDETFDIA